MMPDASETPRHSIQLVARRTGLTPAVIRAWERRYQAIQPSRSPTHRRRYSDREVERLVLLRRVTLAGRRIGAVANLSEEGLRQLLREDEAAATRVPQARGDGASIAARPFLRASLDAIRDMDEARLDGCLSRAGMELNTLELMDDLLAPLLRSVGRLWEEGSLEIYSEHMTTASVRSLLENLRHVQARPSGGPDVVVTTPAGHVHDIGALMVALTAGSRNWRVTYLGPDMPARQIAEAASRCRARAVAISLVYPDYDSKLERELLALRAEMPADATLLIGGPLAAVHESALERIGGVVPGSLSDLRDELDRLRLHGP